MDLSLDIQLIVLFIYIAQKQGGILEPIQQTGRLSAPKGNGDAVGGVADEGRVDTACDAFGYGSGAVGCSPEVGRCCGISALGGAQEAAIEGLGSVRWWRFGTWGLVRFLCSVVGRLWVLCIGVGVFDVVVMVVAVVVVVVFVAYGRNFLCDHGGGRCRCLVGLRLDVQRSDRGSRSGHPP